MFSLNSLTEDDGTSRPPACTYIKPLIDVPLQQNSPETNFFFSSLPENSSTGSAAAAEASELQDQPTAGKKRKSPSTASEAWAHSTQQLQLVITMMLVGKL